MEDEDTQLELEEDAFDRAPSANMLERVRAVSLALGDAARRTRVSLRARETSYGGGFKARRGARLVRRLLFATFALIVVVPTLATGIYYGAFASDQYVSEADFTVSVGDMPVPDGVASISGIPAMAIVQDTQIVVNFLHSRAAVEKLNKMVDLRALYDKPDADGLARFSKTKPIERFLKYWESMATASIVMPAGIVQMKIRAFAPDDAERIAQAALEICERMINDLNTRANQDAVTRTEEELQRASKRVAAALAALETARNESGILETSKSAESLNQLVKEAKSRLISLQGAYDSSLKFVNAEAPQMKELSSRIDVARRQVSDIERKLTTDGSEGPNGQPSLAVAMTRFGELDLEREVSEKLYSTAASALEAAQMNAENRQMYLKTFVYPTAPQQALYPKRALNTLLVALGGLVIWAVLCGLGVLVRNNLA